MKALPTHRNQKFKKSFLMMPTTTPVIQEGSARMRSRSGSISSCSESLSGRRRGDATVVTSNVKFQRIIEDMAVTEEEMKEFLEREGGLQALKNSMKSSGIVTNSSVLQGIHFFVRECNLRIAADRI